MNVSNIIAFLVSLSYGIIHIAFPKQVPRFNKWFYRGKMNKEITIYHLRNGGIAWTVFTIIIFIVIWETDGKVFHI
jgi:hypothetical protein